MVGIIICEFSIIKCERYHTQKEMCEYCRITLWIYIYRDLMEIILLKLSDTINIINSLEMK